VGEHDSGRVSEKKELLEYIFSSLKDFDGEIFCHNVEACAERIALRV
jgi:hypothetical protein